MKTVLLPHDGSELGTLVVQALERVLAREPFAVTILHVTSLAHARERRPAIELARARLQRAGAGVTVIERFGEPVREILDTVAALNPTWIAMASRGRRAPARWVGGSVVERVVRSSPVPALVATGRAAAAPGRGGVRRILVPLDGTEDSATALPLVVDLARSHGSQVVLVRVEWDPARRPLLATRLTRRRQAETLQPWRARLERAAVDVDVVGLRGDPAREIARFARDARCDLIVMATHARRGVVRWLDGSTFARVLRRAGPPILVTRMAPSRARSSAWQDV